MKTFITALLFFFSTLSFAQYMPQLDSAVTYPICNGRLSKEIYYYRKNEVYLLERFYTNNKKITIKKPDAVPHKQDFACGAIKCEIFATEKGWATKNKCEYERDDKGIIWRKQYDSTGALTEDYKR